MEAQIPSLTLAFDGTFSQALANHDLVTVAPKAAKLNQQSKENTGIWLLNERAIDL